MQVYIRGLFILTFLIYRSAAFSQKTTIKNNQRIFSLSPNIKLNDFLSNTVIVKFKTAPLIDSNSKNPKISLKTASILSIKKKFVDNPTTLKSIIPNNFYQTSTLGKETNSLKFIYEFKFSGTIKIEDIINELLQDKNVEYAEPSYVSHILYVPNDPLYPSQSYLNQVMAPQAWGIIKNSSGVTIAIVDNGSQIAHQDLAANIYINSLDLINGIDDEHDGYIDNYYGWDFGGTSASNPQEDNNPNVKDASGNHGIHVSGLASAVSDNNIGISSIAGNAKLMIIKAAADDDENTIYQGYEGIKYAADHGAQIINCSWGTSAGGSYGQDIINYALSKNCLVVAAAGNSSNSDPIYPAAYAGVLAVANVQSTDIVSTTSSFGSYVSISAPGTNITSTFFNNTYGILSGTSMAAPIVSSAAALVKSYFPTLTMQQVGERLRVTADNIDNKNPTLKGLLGKGRLNVFNALTQSSPSIRNQNLAVSSKSVSQGDTIQLYLDLKNFLDPAKGLIVTLTSSSLYVKILNPQMSAGDIATLQTKTMIGPFNVQILPTAPDNSLALFQINYTANNNSYNDFESFSIPVGIDYINVQVNNINTTMTSNGRVGYSSTNATNGLGFQYKNANYLFEASLMIGNSSTAVSNNARNSIGSDEDFIKKIKAKRNSNLLADFEGRSEFDDSGSANPLNIYVRHRQLAYAKAPDDKYSLVEYTVINKNTATLGGLYIGLYTDWDVDANGHDVTEYDPLNKLGYTYGKFGNTIYAGVKLLTNSALPVYYPLSNAATGNLLANGFSTEAKFQTLSKGIEALSLGDNSANGYDVSFVSGYGPYNIAPGDSVKVAFAFLAGDNLASLENSADAAQNKYLTISPDVVNYSTIVLKQNYPNPAQNNTLIQFSIPGPGTTMLNVYNISGRKVKTLINSNLLGGNYAVNMNVTVIPAGMYIYKLTFNSTQKSLKMLVIK